MINIKVDSKKIEKGDTFVAIKGYKNDGHDFIEEAIENGAVKVVCEHGNYNVETLKVSDTKKWLNEYLVSNYKNIIDEMKFIGVTGTNGKTTTCFITYELLSLLKEDVCYIGTIGYKDKNKSFTLSNTTPSILELYNILIDAYNSGIRTVVMEVSSHSLVENRIEGIKFDAVGFTNVTEDHLDFHKTMENYFEAKLKLLDYVKENAKIVINDDDKYLKNIICKNKVSLGYNGKTLSFLNHIDFKEGTIIKFKYKDFKYCFFNKLKNEFNVYNFLMSVLLIKNLGYSIEEILKYAKLVLPPEGRCENINYDDKSIIIDYAHTPDALEKIIKSFKKSTKGKIITIIGCGGDREKEKRPIMGDIATKNSNYVIITSDNPRSEDPDKIIKDIVRGIKKDNYKVIQNRKEAIKEGISLLKKDDILLVLGKGHENYQIIGSIKYPFSDKETVLECIKTLKKGDGRY